ncbi:hypothetical protein J2Z48_001588 [Croceifilum oryzae]|uniref:Uncharacterized protein n=1 Tax=Croceifilum oryzae TaxID=1553429 RepID=A0AAJ1WS84_9BACL|nr:hypothetical protein [Croceifilum oryzae]MDQ0417415.1 hypothetical protein [Croceifilum oryzae]
MLKLLVQGSQDELSRFFLQFRTHKEFIVHPDSIQLQEEDLENAKLYVSFDFCPESRENLTIQMMTEKGTIVKLDLLDGIVTRFDDGKTYIRGKLYDIFG